MVPFLGVALLWSTPTGELKERLILVTHVDLTGNRGKFYAYIGPHVAAYARKCDADLVVSRNRTSKYQDIHVNFDKMFTLRAHLAYYRRVLAIDDTTFISPNCPDLFSMVPESHVGAVREARNDVGGRDWSKYMTETCRAYGCSTKEYMRRKEELPINSGLLLVTRGAKADMLFDGIDGLAQNGTLRPLRTTVWVDQPLYNSRILQHGIPVQDLGIAFNLVGSVYLRQDAMGARRAACIVHLTKFVTHFRSGDGKGREGLAKHLANAATNGSELLCEPSKLRSMEDFFRLAAEERAVQKALRARRRWARRIAIFLSSAGVLVLCVLVGTRRLIHRNPYG